MPLKDYFTFFFFAEHIAVTFFSNLKGQSRVLSAVVIYDPVAKWQRKSFYINCVHIYTKTSLLELDLNSFKYSDQGSSTLSVRAFSTQEYETAQPAGSRALSPWLLHRSLQRWSKFSTFLKKPLRDWNRWLTTHGEAIKTLITEECLRQRQSSIC